MVFPFVETEEQAAAVGKLVVHLCIDIIKIVIEFLVLRQKRPCHQVEIGAAAGQAKGGFIFQDRAFEVQLAGQQADADCTMIILHITVVCPDIYDRRQTAAVAGGKRTFEKRDLFHGFRSEDGEHA